eukprot:m.358474 g.358474  ORF g.358474 m.358474 type:complete len:489 (+) comp18154_c0_seq1:239-1705(+)
MHRLARFRKTTPRIAASTTHTPLAPCMRWSSTAQIRGGASSNCTGEDDTGSLTTITCSKPFDLANFRTLLETPLHQWPQDDYTHLRPNVGACDISASFGSDKIRENFLVDFCHWDFINHGAFGATLANVTDHAVRWRLFQERQPLRYFDRILLPEIARVMQEYALFAEVSPTDIVFTQNATAGLNTVIASLGKTLKAGDTVLSLDIGYGSVHSMLNKVVSDKDCRHHRLSVPLPVANEQDLVDSLRNYLDTCGTPPAFAVFDHITSNTGMVLPLAQMAALCKERGVKVVADGAHGLLQTCVDHDQLRESGVNYYITNCHKWLCSAKSVGVLWAASEQDKALLSPLMVSHGHGSDFNTSFLWDGCRDYSSILSLPGCFHFWTAFGRTNVREYTHSLVASVAADLRDAWNTDPLCPSSMHANMAMVELPQHLQKRTATEVQNAFYNNSIEVPVKRLSNNKLYVRISGHVYNRATDYESLKHLALHPKFLE